MKFREKEPTLIVNTFKTRAAERILINTNLSTKYSFSRIIYPATTITQFYKSNTYISYPRGMFYQRTA